MRINKQLCKRFLSSLFTWDEIRFNEIATKGYLD